MCDSILCCTYKFRNRVFTNISPANFVRQNCCNISTMSLVISPNFNKTDLLTYLWLTCKGYYSFLLITCILVPCDANFLFLCLFPFSFLHALIPLLILVSYSFSFLLVHS